MAVNQVPAGPVLEIRVAAAHTLELRGARLARWRAGEGEVRRFTLHATSTLTSLRVIAWEDHVCWTSPGEVEQCESGPLEVACASGVATDGSRGGAAVAGPVTVDLGKGSSTSYRGVIRVHAAQGVLAVTNLVSLEVYLESVVASELSASVASLEALKAQAVAARTFVLHGIQAREIRGQPVEFAADQSFQVYGGVEKEHPKASQAVRETVGEVLTFRERLFRTYFHSTCGGKTASGAEIFGEAPIEPLGGVECSDCDGARYSRWSSAWSWAELLSALRPLDARIPGGFERIDSIEVADREPAGRARYVRVQHPGGSFEVLAVRFRALLGARRENPVRSTLLAISRREEGLVFEGRGWGHGVGLCQAGAQAKGERMDYRAVLRSYYPGSVVEKAYAASSGHE